METQSIAQKRELLKPGSYVKIFTDDWTLNGKEGIVLDPHPIEGSSQCLVAVESEAITLPIHDVFKV